MKYTFITNPNHKGGPKSRAINFAQMLTLYADFDFDVINSNKTDIKKIKSDIIHVHSDLNLIKNCVINNKNLIVGPNVVWQTADKNILEYSNMKCVFIQRPDPYPRKLNPIWIDKVNHFPAIVNEEFFSPSNCKKTIDILTIGKSFHYPEYENNLNQVKKYIKQNKLNHTHLDFFSWQTYKEYLDKSKILIYPSPREAGASLCHALLESSMMNVPFMGLSSVVIKAETEYNECRGTGFKNVTELCDNIKTFLDNYNNFSPREWVINRFSLKSGYDRLKKVLDGN